MESGEATARCSSVDSRLGAFVVAVTALVAALAFATPANAEASAVPEELATVDEGSSGAAPAESGVGSTPQGSGDPAVTAPIEPAPPLAEVVVPIEPAPATPPSPAPPDGASSPEGVATDPPAVIEPPAPPVSEPPPVADVTGPVAADPAPAVVVAPEPAASTRRQRSSTSFSTAASGYSIVATSLSRDPVRLAPSITESGGGGSPAHVRAEHRHLLPATSAPPEPLRLLHGEASAFSGGGGSSGFFFGFAALAAALSLAAAAGLTRRLNPLVAPWTPVAFVSPQERPG